MSSRATWDVSPSKVMVSLKPGARTASRRPMSPLAQDAQYSGIPCRLNSLLKLALMASSFGAEEKQ